MYKNLKAEMVRNDISNNDIAKAIGKEIRAVRSKMAGTTAFTFPETMVIRDTFFPNMTLEYLFEQSAADEKVGA